MKTKNKKDHNFEVMVFHLSKDLGGVTLPHLHQGRWLPVPSSEILAFILFSLFISYYTASKKGFQEP